MHFDKKDDVLAPFWIILSICTDKCKSLKYVVCNSVFK